MGTYQVTVKANELRRGDRIFYGWTFVQLLEYADYRSVAQHKGWCLLVELEGTTQARIFDTDAEFTVTRERPDSVRLDGVDISLGDGGVYFSGVKGTYILEPSELVNALRTLGVYLLPHPDSER